MRSVETEGRLQVIAAAALLERSRLVRWASEASEFIPTQRAAFEAAYRTVDPVFGRLMCWMLFSAGAELLAKGVCLLWGVDMRKPKLVPAPPHGDIDQWASEFRLDPLCCGSVDAVDFRPMGELTSGDSGLLDLCRRTGATAAQENRLLAAYDLLRTTIRNRDAHAYVPKVRGADQPKVASLFVGCFNLLVGWLPGGPATLTDWRLRTAEFVDGL